jgi:hypothetical protein
MNKKVKFLMNLIWFSINSKQPNLNQILFIKVKHKDLSKIRPKLHNFNNSNSNSNNNILNSPVIK